MKPKAAIYDPYLNTLGGGERYCLTVAEILLKEGYQVDLFWSGAPDLIKKAQDRFNLNLKDLNIVPDIFQISMNEMDLIEDQQFLKETTVPPLPQNLLHKLKNTSQYDLIFYLSDGSLPFIFGKKNLLHSQVPFKLKLSFKTRLLNQLKLRRFQHIICNSQFTSKIIQDLYHRPTQVIYPPVDVQQFFVGKKDPIIISVGRFDNILNAKKQDVLIRAFSILHQQSPYRHWKLYLVGGSTQAPPENQYLNHLHQLANGLPVEFFINPNFSTLKDLYSHASIYWHAAGFGIDQNLHPENTEHFGITVVEAMASGAVPVVVSRGGLPEIVTPNLNGYLWSNPEELVAHTRTLIDQPQQLQQFSQQCQTDCLKYSKENFAAEIHKIISDP